MIYLDSASTTKLHQQVLECIKNNMENYFANPSSLHKLGFESEQLITIARNCFSKILNLKSEQIFFTSGATESNNWAIQAAYKKNKRLGNILVASKADHPSVLKKLEAMQNQHNCKIILLPVNKDGIINIEYLNNTDPEKIILISLLWVNNETGVIQDLNKLIHSIKTKFPNCLIHVDAVQGFCKINDFRFINSSDYISISAHKIGGPKGVGALIVKDYKNIEPLIFGGGQEFNKRSGTENISGIIGFAEAFKIMHENIKNHYSKIKEFQEIFENTIKNSVPEVIINGANSNRSPYISSVSLKNIKAEVLVHTLAEKNIFISTGSACTSKKNSYSSVLTAMDLSKEYLQGSIRVSFFVDLEESNIIFAAKELLNALCA